MICTVADCDKSAKSRGWCSVHYQRWYANGDPMMLRPRQRPSIAERLVLYSVAMPSGCREWTGSTDGRMGYGKLSCGGRMMFAHRLAWTISHDRSIPTGMQIRHSCDNPSCIEPAHLLLGTQKDNVRDMLRRGRSDRRGERNNSAKLNKEQIAEIRLMRKRGALLAEIAGIFGVCQSQVSNIVNYRQWKGSPMIKPTLASVIARFDVDVLAHLDRQADIPILSGLQRQGDVIAVPDADAGGEGALVPPEGVAVVRGENGGNTHLLLADGDVRWRPIGDGALLGELTVNEGAVAYLAHPEHGYQGFAPGCYRVQRKREQMDEIRLVSD